MENTTLEMKIDMLGQMMYDMEKAEDSFRLAYEDEYKQIDELKQEIKDEVMELGRTVETLKLKVEFRRGSNRWDTRFLEGYAINHPELLQYRREGAPTVAFKLKDEGLF